MTNERKDQLFDEMLNWICEHTSGSRDMFIALHEVIGMTQEELHDCSIESLDCYFNEEQKNTDITLN